VQFFQVVGGEDPDGLEDKAPAVARWDDPRPTSRLGFIANLKDLQEEHAKLGAEVERTRQLTLNLLVLGYFLLAATILGLTLNNLLSIGSDPSLVDRVSKAVPDSASDKLLLAAALVTVAWLVRSIVVFILGGPTPPIPEGDRFYYLRARQDLVVNRRRWRAAIMFVAGLLAFGIAWLAIEQDFAHEELLWALLATALGCGAIIADWKLVKPIDAHAVRERTDLLKELNDERAEELEKRAEKLEKRAEKLDERVEKIDERARKRDARAKKRDERAEDLETRAEELDRRAEKLDERVEKLDERARKRDARAKERHERSEQADALND
jgi:methyl-accepting chemotaxis protein